MIVVDASTRKEYDIDASRQGENYQVCPKCSHERKKQKIKCFSFNTDKQTGHCSHCDMKVYTKQEIAPKKEYKIPVWQNVTEIPDKAVRWFKDRGISQQTLIDAKVSYGEEWLPQVDGMARCIKFPYFKDGQCVNIKFRDGQKNFKLVSGAELVFFNLDSIKGQKEVIITEGEIDALSYMEAGFKSVVSVPNGAARGSLKLEYLDNCWQYFEGAETIYLATDDDDAGKILQDELARRFGHERCKKVFFEGYKDANELLKEHPLKLAETIQNSREYPIEGVYTAYDIRDEIWALKRDGVKKGCSAHMGFFDELLTFEPGYFTMITGVPSHGKTSFLDQILVNLSVFEGWKMALYSPESWPIKMHHARLSAKLTGKWLKNQTDVETQQGIDYLSDRFYFIMPEKVFDVDDLIATVKQLIKKHGIKAFVIDAWNKLEHKYSGSETQYISVALDKLDMFCKQNGVHLFLVAHPTKIKKKDSGEFEIPTLYDISGSANFYNKAANGITVYKRKISDDSYINEVYVQKVKFENWGKEGCSTYSFNTSSGRFYDKDKDDRNYLNLDTYEQKSIEFDPIKPNTEFLNTDNEESPF